MYSLFCFIFNKYEVNENIFEKYIYIALEVLQSDKRNYVPHTGAEGASGRPIRDGIRLVASICRLPMMNIKHMQRSILEDAMVLCWRNWKEVWEWWSGSLLFRTASYKRELSMKLREVVMLIIGQDIFIFLSSILDMFLDALREAT